MIFRLDFLLVSKRVTEMDVLCSYHNTFLIFIFFFFLGKQFYNNPA